MLPGSKTTNKAKASNKITEKKLKSTFYPKESFPSKESDTKILQGRHHQLFFNYSRKL